MGASVTLNLRAWVSLYVAAVLALAVVGALDALFGDAGLAGLAILVAAARRVLGFGPACGEHHGERGESPDPCGIAHSS